MHTGSIHQWQHSHTYLGTAHDKNAARTWIVVGLAAIAMIGEIIAGYAFGSMALLADGFHMATHVGALTLAGLAYIYARRHAKNRHFTFGTGKVGELAGYSSAIVLAIFAIMIAIESFERLVSPVPIRFDGAILVAVIGLVVNLASAWILHGDGHSHDHAGHDDHHDHHDHHHDHNFRAAYFHVLADAVTSLLAIAGLLAGRYYGWVWMDPLMGIVGAIVIARWSWLLLRGAGAVLLDTMPDHDLPEKIRTLLEKGDDRVADLHVWQIGPGHLAVIVSIVSHAPQSPSDYKNRLSHMAQLSHITVEIHHCTDGAEC